MTEGKILGLFLYLFTMKTERKENEVNNFGDLLNISSEYCTFEALTLSKVK